MLSDLEFYCGARRADEVFLGGCKRDGQRQAEQQHRRGPCREPRGRDDTHQRVGTEHAATQASNACGRMDLLTVVMHELGHVLGRPHEDGAGVMAEALPTGVRRLPGLPHGREPDPPDRWRSDAQRAGVVSAIGKGGVQ